MTDNIKDLIADAREWPRDGVNEGRLINGLADALEKSETLREHHALQESALRYEVTNLEGKCDAAVAIADRAVAMAERVVAERDDLRTAIQDALRDLWAVPMSATKEARHILSRAIDTKEKP